MGQGVVSMDVRRGIWRTDDGMGSNADGVRRFAKEPWRLPDLAIGLYRLNSRARVILALRFTAAVWPLLGLNMALLRFTCGWSIGVRGACLWASGIILAWYVIKMRALKRIEQELPGAI